MFGLFRSKGEKPEEPVQNTGNRQFRELAGRFLPEELTILAVTGANGFAGSRSGPEPLWTAHLGLTAWKEEDSPQIHQGEFVLTTIADDRLLDVLRQRTPPDFIVKCRARVSRDSRELLLLDLPGPGFDPGLNAVLEEQKKPVTLQADGLGVFTLNRRVDWFETGADWLGTEISISFDREDEAEMEQSMNTARALLDHAADWDRRVREYAADELVQDANDWAEDEEITREDFMARMELEAIQVECDGSFQFWFADGDMFYGHSIHVTGSLEQGPVRAEMEG